jgi:hypothetical protein
VAVISYMRRRIIILIMIALPTINKDDCAFLFMVHVFVYFIFKLVEDK